MQSLLPGLIGVLSIFIIILLIVIVRKKKRVNFQKLLLKAEAALIKEKINKAQKYYEKIIRILEKRSQLTGLQRKYLGEAYLGMGKVFEAKNDSYLADSYYTKALKNSIPVSNLPETAITLLGNTFSKEKDKSQIAVEVYLRFIKLKPRDKTSEKVYSFLENLCFIDETKKSHHRKQSIALNESVLFVNPKLEWVHFYLGVSSFLDNNLSKAKKYLSNSISLNSKRALSYYWLGKTYLASNQIESAAKYFLTFIKLIDAAKETLKQAEANFYVAKSLIEKIGGFSESIDLSVEENSEKLKSAITYFEQATLKNSNNADYYFHFAQTLRHAGNFEMAKKKIIAALAIEKRDEYHKLLAELSLITNDFAEAENQCLKVFGTKKGFDFEIFCILVPALYHQAKYRDVVNTCKAYPSEIEVTKKSQNTVFYIARSYSQIGNFERAIEWYKELIENEQRSDAWYYLGCALANKGDLDTALMVFNEFISDGDKYKTLACLQCGHIFFKTGQTKDAEENYQKAYSIAPKNVDILYSLGLFYYNTGNDEKALHYLSDILALNPEHSLAHYVRGLVYEKQGNVSQAIREYERTLTEGTTSSKGYLRLGVIYCRQSDYQKAFNYLQKAYQSGDRSDTVLFYIGLSSTFNKQYGMALEAWNELQKRYPEDSKLRLNIQGVHYLLGCNNITENKYLDAISEWEEYLKEYSEVIETKRNLAEIYFRACVTEIKKNDISKAKELILKAKELDGDNTNYLYYSGICDFGMGRYSECITQYNKLLESQPDNPRLKYHVGLSLLRKGEKEKAMGILNGLVKNGDKNTYENFAASVIANEYIKEGQYNEAIPILEALR